MDRRGWGFRGTTPESPPWCSYPKGNVSRYLHTLKAGDEVKVKGTAAASGSNDSSLPMSRLPELSGYCVFGTCDAGPFPKLPYKRNTYKSIGMLAAGTGIAPMIQVSLLFSHTAPNNSPSLPPHPPTYLPSRCSMRSWATRRTTPRCLWSSPTSPRGTYFLRYAGGCTLRLSMFSMSSPCTESPSLPCCAEHQGQLDEWQRKHMNFHVWHTLEEAGDGWRQGRGEG